MFSVEPGVYLDGETGVRIEDLVAFDAAAGSLERLTALPARGHRRRRLDRWPRHPPRCGSLGQAIRGSRPSRRHPDPARTEKHAPPMISTGDLQKGIAIELDGELWQILDYHHIKMGRGSAQVRIKLRNIKRGQTVERTFQAGDKWPRAILEKRPVQFLYQDGDDYHFMENESYEQFHLTAEQLGDVTDYLVDGMTLDRTSYEGETIGIELPISVDLRVAETEPGFAGDTAIGRPQAGDDGVRPRRPGAHLRRRG